MAYGKIIADTLTYDNGGSDTDVTISSLAGKVDAANPTFTGNVTLNAAGDLRLADSDSSNYVGFKSPGTVGTNLVWTLPATDGSPNYLLKTDGSGNLGWAADSATDSTKLPLDGSGVMTGNLVFEGSTANDFETTITPTDATADRTITLPDASGTVALGVIGTDIQAYDADTAKKDVDQEWTKPQRGHVEVATHSTGTDYNFNLDDHNNWKLTISAGVKLNFTSADLSTREGQTGTIYIDNGAVTPTWGDEVAFEGGTTLSITQNKKSLISYYVLPGGDDVLVTGILDVTDD